jgi:septum formation protein
VLVLASASPQRKAILEQLGVPFTVQPANVEELTSGEPAQVVVDNALRKARAVDGDLVLGSDTEVFLDGVIFGKATDERHAEDHLRRLSGRTHQVYSGVALIDAGEERTSFAVTDVTFRELRDEEVAWYIGTGEWRGRAGAYAIQGRGSALVERIDGDFWNVVGLPVPELLRLAPDLVIGCKEQG